MEFLDNGNNTKCSAAIDVEYNTEHVFSLQCYVCVHCTVLYRVTCTKPYRVRTRNTVRFCTRFNASFLANLSVLAAMVARLQCTCIVGLNWILRSFSSFFRRIFKLNSFSVMYGRGI